MNTVANVPVVLVAYARPDLLVRTLAALKADHVPDLRVFCDGPKGDADRNAVSQVRDIVRNIDWCHTEIVERDLNMGLGRSVLAAVTEVLNVSDRVIVFEDDVVCVPGTYRYLCAALDRYAKDKSVMSVAAWTHPRVTPDDIGDMPYFDGRFNCWGWATWRRAWRGMDTPASVLLRRARLLLRDVNRYGR